MRQYREVSKGGTNLLERKDKSVKLTNIYFKTQYIDHEIVCVLTNEKTNFKKPAKANSNSNYLVHLFHFCCSIILFRAQVITKVNYPLVTIFMSQ